MAKQSGIHQLRGKLGEMSYYRQAGVDPGLVRRINQGMSARVKTADEFANTRLNNSEFKIANAIATAAFHAVRPSWRSMFRRFAIAYLTKRVLESIRSGSGNWGVRYPQESYGNILQDALLRYAKLGEYLNEYGTASYSEDAVGEQDEYLAAELSLTISESDQVNMKAEGIDGISVISGSLFVSQGTDGTVWKGLSLPRIDTAVFASTPAEIELNISEVTPSGAAYHMVITEWVKAEAKGCAGTVFINVLCPFRVVDGVQHILQEKCTFICDGHPVRS